MNRLRLFVTLLWMGNLSCLANLNASQSDETHPFAFSQLPADTSAVDLEDAQKWAYALLYENPGLTTPLAQSLLRRGTLLSSHLEEEYESDATYHLTLYHTQQQEGVIEEGAINLIYVEDGITGLLGIYPFLLTKDEWEDEESVLEEQNTYQEPRRLYLLSTTPALFAPDTAWKKVYTFAQRMLEYKKSLCAEQEDASERPACYKNLRTLLKTTINRLSAGAGHHTIYQEALRRYGSVTGQTLGDRAIKRLTDIIALLHHTLDTLYKKS